LIGEGRAHGAVSVLNAIATGVGGAVGIELNVRAVVRLTPSPGVIIESHTPWGRVGSPDALRDAIQRAAQHLGHEGGIEVTVHSEIPPASGLKSSSAVVNAILDGITDALGIRISTIRKAAIGVEVARMAGLTITGAYDDSLATLGEGVYITDNERLRILRWLGIWDGLYAVVRVPSTGRPIDSVDPHAFKRLRSAYKAAADLALRGLWREAMTANGLLTLAATGWDKASLELIVRALSIRSVVAAGVSGKGPSVFAVTTEPAEVLQAWGEESLIVARVLGGKR